MPSFLIFFYTNIYTVYTYQVFKLTTDNGKTSPRKNHTQAFD